MKKLYKHYKVFFPLIYSIVVLLGAPLLTAGISILEAGMKTGVVGIIVILAALSVIYLFFDYFVFNGISSKGSSLRLMKSSLKGYRILKKGIIMDMVFRMVSIMFCTIMSTLIINKNSEQISIPYNVSIVFALIVYALCTAALIVLRYVDGASVYGPIVSLSSMGIVLAIVGIFYLWTYGYLTIIWTYVIAIVAVAVASFFGTYSVLRSYKNSFVK